MLHSFPTGPSSLALPATFARRSRLGALLVAVAVASCDCGIDDDDLAEIEDAGFDPVDAGPPPPKFPLKAGDRVRYPALGGRTATCDNGTEGACDRALNAEYLIEEVTLGEDNRWAITASVVYQGSSENIEAAAIVPLILDNVAPFADVTVATPDTTESAVFKTNEPPTTALTPLGFPFFQFDPDNVDVFESAGQQFCDSWLAVDPEANCEVQFGDQKMEVYYKDGSSLHKLRAEFHKMGFLCGWDEGIIPFDESVERDQSAFGPADTPDLAAIFVSPITIRRDDVTYNCSCFTQTCKAGNGAEAKCLPLDPDAEPGPCPQQP